MRCCQQMEKASLVHGVKWDSKREFDSETIKKMLKQTGPTKLMWLTVLKIALYTCIKISNYNYVNIKL